MASNSVKRVTVVFEKGSDFNTDDSCLYATVFKKYEDANDYIDSIINDPENQTPSWVKDRMSIYGYSVLDKEPAIIDGEDGYNWKYNIVKCECELGEREEVNLE